MPYSSQGTEPTSGTTTFWAHLSHSLLSDVATEEDVTEIVSSQRAFELNVATAGHVVSASRKPERAEVLGLRGGPRIVGHCLLIRPQERRGLTYVAHLLEDGDEPPQDRRFAGQPPV